MPQGGSDNAIFVNSSGNLSLGQYGLDDGAGNTTYGYAKNDVTRILQHTSFAAALPTTNLTESVTRTSAGIWGKVYTAGGTVDSFVLINPPFDYRNLASARLSPAFGTQQPHGFMVNSFDLNYIVATAGATAITVRAQTETAQTNNVARANSSTTPLGTTTVQNPVGTTVSVLPVATQAAPYQTRTVFGTPIFVTDGKILTFEIELSLPNTSVVTITYAAFNIAWAMY